MSRDTASTHLRRLGVNPITVARLEGYAQEDDLTLTELVQFILGDYMPPEPANEDDDHREAESNG